MILVNQVTPNQKLVKRTRVERKGGKIAKKLLDMDFEKKTTFFLLPPP